jgi:hypothetical protein
VFKVNIIAACLVRPQMYESELEAFKRKYNITSDSAREEKDGTLIFDGEINGRHALVIHLPCEVNSNDDWPALFRCMDRQELDTLKYHIDKLREPAMLLDDFMELNIHARILNYIDKLFESNEPVPYILQTQQQFSALIEAGVQSMQKRSSEEKTRILRNSP